MIAFLKPLLKPRWLIMIALGLMLGAQTLRLSIRDGQLSDARDQVTATEAERDSYVAALEQTETAYRTAQATALRLSIEAVEAEEKRNKEINHDIQNTLERRLAAALADSRAAPHRMRAPIAASPTHRPPGTINLPAVASAAADPVAAGDPAFMDAEDQDICTANTIFLEGWREWHERIKSPVSAPATPAQTEPEADAQG